MSLPAICRKRQSSTKVVSPQPTSFMGDRDLYFHVARSGGVKEVNIGSGVLCTVADVYFAATLVIAGVLISKVSISWHVHSMKVVSSNRCHTPHILPNPTSRILFISTQRLLFLERVARGSEHRSPLYASLVSSASVAAYNIERSFIEKSSSVEHSVASRR